MKHVKKSTLVIIFSLSSCAVSATIFVDNNLASDCTSGEYSIARRDHSGSDGNAYVMLQAAATASAAGDTIYIRAGIYNPTSTIQVQDKTGTTPSAKITFTNYNSEVVTISGVSLRVSNSDYVVVNGLVLSGSAGIGIICTSGSDYVEMRNLTIENTTGEGIYVAYSEHVTIEKVIVRQSGSAGISVIEAGYASVAQSRIYNNSGSGIYFRGSSHGTIDRNELYNNVMGVQMIWRDSNQNASAYNTISNNLIHDHTSNPEASDGISVGTGTHHNIVTNNVVYGNADDGIDCSTQQGAQGPGSNLYEKITGNIVFNNGDGASGAGDGNGIKVSTNNGGGYLIGNNIAFDNERAGFDQDKEVGFPQNFFYQNIAYNNAAGGFFMDAPSLPQNEDAVLYNNIAANNGVSDLRKSNDLAVNDSDYNWWGDGRFVVGMDAHSLSGDPQFNNSGLVVDTTFGAGWSIDQKLEYVQSQVKEKFRLQASSSAVDHGRLISGYHCSMAGDHPEEGLQEWYGNAPDMGVYETALSAIVDLSVSGTSQNSVTVAWTAPGGLTYRTPTQYDLRYADSAMTEGNWGTTTPAQGEPVPGAVGTPQSFTITGLNPGSTYYVALKTSDASGNTSWLSNVVTATTATSGNSAPVLEPIGDRSTYETQSLTFTVSAADADAGDTPTYSATSLPLGANFSPATRTFAWTPTNNQSGIYHVVFGVTDSQVVVSQTIAITVLDTVNHAPVLAAVGDQAVNENAPLTFCVSATDEDGGTLTYSATGLPDGVSFENRIFSWTPNYEQAGSYQVTFTVSDGELTDSEQITITVANISDETAPSAQDFSPAADAFQVPINTLIALTISDNGSGIEAGTVAISVNNQLVYTGGDSVYQSDYGICRRTGTRASYRYYYQPAQPFDFDQHVSVYVTASDAVHNAMAPVSYEFVTEMHSFSRNELVCSGGDSSGHAALATDSHGNLWAAWHAGAVGAREIYVATRSSQLHEWNTPLRLTNLASDQCDPAIAIGSDDTLYVVWQDNRRGNWDVYASASLDGSTWGNPVRVTDSNDSQVNPVIAVDHASPYRVYIAWERGNTGSRDIYLASSTTAFASKTITQVTSAPADQTEPALAVGSDNTVYLVWTDQRNGPADIYGSSSSASSWANVAVVTGPGNQSHPALAVEPGTSTLHVLWTDDAAGNLDVRHGSSNGLPGSPIAGTSLSDDATGADQSAPALVATKDHGNNTRVYACWQDNRSAGDSDLYFVEIRSGVGGTNILVGDDGTNSNQSAPALGCDEYGQPVVLWTDSRSSTPQIYSAGSTYSKPVALTSALITRSAGGRVGTDPASISSEEDVSIQIPANASDCDMTVSISRIQNLPKFATLCLIGWEIGPSGVHFSFPATVTIPYTGSGSSPVTPYWYDPQTGTLSQQGMTEVASRTLGNGIPVVSFKTTHLTSFYLLANPLPAGVGSGGGGGCALSASPEGNVLGFFLPYTVLALLMLVLRWKDQRHKRV